MCAGGIVENVTMKEGFFLTFFPPAASCRSHTLHPEMCTSGEINLHRFAVILRNVAYGTVTEYGDFIIFSFFLDPFFSLPMAI